MPSWIPTVVSLVGDYTNRIESAKANFSELLRGTSSSLCLAEFRNPYHRRRTNFCVSMHSKGLARFKAEMLGLEVWLDGGNTGPASSAAMAGAGFATGDG